MSFVKYCEERGYDPGMDMTRETRIQLAEGYAKKRLETRTKEIGMTIQEFRRQNYGQTVVSCEELAEAWAKHVNKELFDLMQLALDIINPALDILPETYDDEIDAFLKAKRDFDND